MHIERNVAKFVADGANAEVVFSQTSIKNLVVFLATLW